MRAEHTAARSAGITAGDYWTVAALAADKSCQRAMSSSAIRQCSFLLLAITGFFTKPKLDSERNSRYTVFLLKNTIKRARGNFASRGRLFLFGSQLLRIISMAVIICRSPVRGFLFR
ncbi:MAG TPA: hypothetical protein VF429_05690 [Anaerolineae bacterium]